jgi:uncharacterized repeat protein (TIGR03803 family)
MERSRARKAARAGCASGNGTAFELTPDSNGKWTEHVLYEFTGGKDGGQPWSGLILDSNGNLYGTTSEGGNSSDCAYSSCGLVFSLTSSANGVWKEHVLHAFTGKDGGGPLANLVFDGGGNLYGTASEGGVYRQGTVFKLTTDLNGKSTEDVLHQFPPGKGAGSPSAGLTFDSAGNLYGTTPVGGFYGKGTVFELAH